MTPTPFLILAAGFSSRMGQLKANVSFQQKTFLQHIISKIPDSHPLFVVLGFQSEHIQQHHPDFKGEWVQNPYYAEGMLSSVQTGLEKLPTNISGVWMWPVDFPLVQHQTLNQLLEQAQKSPEKVLVPSYQNKRGHPVYIPKSLFLEIQQLPKSLTLRTILFKNPSLVFHLNVEDSGVLQNLNTLKEIEKL